MIQCLEVCLNVLNNKGSLGELNQTLISLILKVKDPKLMENYRPISLCNMVYKLISKTFGNRLKKWLAILISQEQSAFVPERQILDNVLVFFETMHKLKGTRVGK